MAQRRQQPQEEAWYLCSQLVSLEGQERDGLECVVLLEEIHTDRARLAVDQPCPIGECFRITTEGIEIRAVATICMRRETNYLIELRFLDGYRWSPEEWRPQHLFLPRPRSAKAEGAAPSA